MPLVLIKEEGESWRDSVRRIAGKQGLEAECLEIFDQEIESGISESRAAWNALYEWDCLPYEEDNADHPD